MTRARTPFDLFAWFRRAPPKLPPRWFGVDGAMLQQQREVVAGEPLSELPALIRTAHTMCNRTPNLKARSLWTAKLWAATERLEAEAAFSYDDV